MKKRSGGKGEGYTPPARRLLNIFATDPMAGNAPGNKIAIDVPNEPLRPGPCGANFEVVDYDPAQRAYYAAVDLDNPNLLMNNGLPQSEADPRFHQQMAYAVAARVLESFERGLGRKLRFRKPGSAYSPLRLYPHGFYGRNAFFDHERNAIFFGYFEADKIDPGRNLPGQMVFACLSHDIIAHELTHAFVHALRPHFMEFTNLDVPAFHEGFSDIVALFQRFSYRDLLRHHITVNNGNLHRGAFLELAAQFGYAAGDGQALRTPLSSTDKPTRLDEKSEAHDRGAILLAAVFEAFLEVVDRRCEDLIRIASGGTGILPNGRIQSDLADRIADEAAKAATSILNMCIRAFDYLPPVDVTFGDFLRAMITADLHAVGVDKLGQRDLVIEAFRRRAIYPEGVSSLAPESLMFEDASEDGTFVLPPDIVKSILQEALMPRPGQTVGRAGPLAYRGQYGTGEANSYSDDETNGIVESDARQQEKRESRDLAIRLHRFAERNRTRLKLDPDKRLGIRVVGWHATERLSPDGLSFIDIVIQYTQHGDRKDAQGPEGYSLRGGTTVVANENGVVLHVIAKPVSTLRARARRDDGDVLRVYSQPARDPIFDWTDEGRAALHLRRRSRLRALHARRRV